MPRSFTIDVLKIMAAQLIFWHHLSAYGDLAQWLSEAAPKLHGFLFEYARMAVQVFLVVSGFLLASHVRLDQRPAWLPLITSRYFRLAPVYWIALLGVSLCVALARPYLSADWLPDVPNWVQVLSHVVLLQDLLDHPSLSTGIWYVAIDLQLYLLLISLAFLTHTFAPQHLREDCFSFLLLGLIALSLLWFNLDPEWDNWAIYFFGSYGLGYLAHIGKGAYRHRWYFGLAIGITLLSLAIDWRWRIGLACGVALLLWFVPRNDDVWPRWQSQRKLLADSSYAFFLTHFGVLVISNLVWQTWQVSVGETSSFLGWAWVVLTWIGSLFWGIATHKWVETPMLSILLNKRQ